MSKIFRPVFQHCADQHHFVSCANYPDQRCISHFADNEDKTKEQIQAELKEDPEIINGLRATFFRQLTNQEC